MAIDDDSRTATLLRLVVQPARRKSVLLLLVADLASSASNRWFARDDETCLALIRSKLDALWI